MDPACHTGGNISLHSAGNLDVNQPKTAQPYPRQHCCMFLLLYHLNASASTCISIHEVVLFLVYSCNTAKSRPVFAVYSLQQGSLCTFRMFFMHQDCVLGARVSCLHAGPLK